MRIRSALPAQFVPLALLAAIPTPARADREMFEITELETSGRVVTAEFADFDGDGLDDLMIATLDGVPPDESRLIHVYDGRSDGSFPRLPSRSLPIPENSAVYDIADLRETPGDELVVLRPDRVTIVSLANDATRQWNLRLEGPTSVGAGPDERGFDPYRLVYDDFGEEPWILVPQIGQVLAMDGDGTPLGFMKVGRRTNYFVTKSAGLLSVETDIQLYFDAPKLAVGDVNGDGLADVVATTRHEIRVFLRESDGGLPVEPSSQLPLGLIDREDHARGSGSVVTNVRDLDGDGLLDLMISHSAGNFTDAETTTYVYHNREGQWLLGEPDDRFDSSGTLTSDLLLDIDSDDKLELLRVQVKFNVFEIVEFLLTREIDVIVAVHRVEEDGSYDMEPWSKRKISTEVSFDTFRPKGFMPTSGIDLDNDGRMDFVSSAGGRGIEVYLGSEKGLFSSKRILQKLPSTGVIRFSDFDGDELLDFLLWDPQAFDSILRVGRNKGAFESTDR
jgi:hypothetical protein